MITNDDYVAESAARIFNNLPNNLNHNTYNKNNCNNNNSKFISEPDEVLSSKFYHIFNTIYDLKIEKNNIKKNIEKINCSMLNIGYNHQEILNNLKSNLEDYVKMSNTIKESFFKEREKTLKQNLEIFEEIKIQNYNNYYNKTYLMRNFENLTRLDIKNSLQCNTDFEIKNKSFINGKKNIFSNKTSKSKTSTKRKASFENLNFCLSFVENTDEIVAFNFQTNRKFSFKAVFPKGCQINKFLFGSKFIQIHGLNSGFITGGFESGDHTISNRMSNSCSSYQSNINPQRKCFFLNFDPTGLNSRNYFSFMKYLLEMLDREEQESENNKAVYQTLDNYNTNQKNLTYNSVFVEKTKRKVSTADKARNADKCLNISINNSISISQNNDCKNTNLQNSNEKSSYNFSFSSTHSTVKMNYKNKEINKNIDNKEAEKKNNLNINTKIVNDNTKNLNFSINSFRNKSASKGLLKTARSLNLKTEPSKNNLPFSCEASNSLNASIGLYSNLNTQCSYSGVYCKNKLNNSYNESENYNINRKFNVELIEITPMNHSRWRHASIIIDKKYLICVSGYENKKCEFLDFSHSQNCKGWKNLPELNIARIDASLFYFNENYLYCFGGISTNIHLSQAKKKLNYYNVKKIERVKLNSFILENNILLEKKNWEFLDIFDNIDKPKNMNYLISSMGILQMNMNNFILMGGDRNFSFENENLFHFKNSNEDTFSYENIDSEKTKSEDTETYTNNNTNNYFNPSIRLLSIDKNGNVNYKLLDSKLNRNSKFSVSNNFIEYEEDEHIGRFYCFDNNNEICKVELKI